MVQKSQNKIRGLAIEDTCVSKPISIRWRLKTEGIKSLIDTGWGAVTSGQKKSILWETLIKDEWVEDWDVLEWLISRKGNGVSLNKAWDETYIFWEDNS